MKLHEDTLDSVIAAIMMDAEEKKLYLIQTMAKRAFPDMAYLGKALLIANTVASRNRWTASGIIIHVREVKNGAKETYFKGSAKDEKLNQELIKQRYFLFVNSSVTHYQLIKGTVMKASVQSTSEANENRLRLLLPMPISMIPIQGSRKGLTGQSYPSIAEAIYSEISE